MVRDCPECGEYAYATRFKDSPKSVCRHCRYYRDAITGEEGFDYDHQINDSELTPLPEDNPLYDPSNWDWERHEPGDGVPNDE